MKRFTKVFGLVICLLVLTIALSGFGVSAAPAKYNAAYFGYMNKHSYQVGSKVQIPVMLSSCEGENQTFELVVRDDMGKAVFKHSDNFPSTQGVTEYNVTVDTKNWAVGEYYISVTNMLDSSVFASDSYYFELYEGIDANINNNNYVNEYNFVKDNLSKPYSVDTYFEIPYGSGYMNMSVNQVYYGSSAENFANMENWGEDRLYAPEGQDWFGFQIYFSNYGESGKQINVNDFISKTFGLVDKNGKPIKIHSYGNMNEWNADRCWSGIVDTDDGNYFYFPALIDSSVGIPYLRVNTSRGVMYIDLNPVKQVNTIKQDPTDKNWYVYTNDVKNDDFYGLVEANGRYWYANGGMVDFEYDGIYYNYSNSNIPNGQYCIKNGLVDTSFNGFYYNEYEDFYHDGYFVNGVNDYSFCGLVQFKGEFVYVDNGTANSERFTGIAPWGGSWWYLNNGVIDYTYEGFTSSNYGEVYIKNGKVATGTSGLIFEEEYNVWRYVKNGVVDNAFTGLAYHSGGYYYVSNGRWQEDYDGMVKQGNTWYAITNGRPDYTFTGVRTYWEEYFDEEGYNERIVGYYFVNGKVNTTTSGLVYVKDEYNYSTDKDGVWYYVEKGAVNFEYDGLVYHSGGYYYVTDGRWYENYSGMTEYYGTWYAITKGRPDFTFTGIKRYYHDQLDEYRQYYFKNGKIDWSANGLVFDPGVSDSKYYGNDGRWAYVKNGTVDHDFEGLYNQAGAWWYVADGYVMNQETLVYFGNTWYYVNGGVVNWNSNTLVNYEGVWYYTKNGVVDWNTETLVQYGNAWYAVKKGVVNWNYTGLMQYANKWFYVQNGSINWSSNTLVKHGNSYYYAKNGQVDWNSETLVLFNGTWYYVNKGVVNFNANTLVKYGNSWYYVEKGVVNWNANKTVAYKGGNYKVVNGVVVF